MPDENKNSPETIEETLNPARQVRCTQCQWREAPWGAERMRHQGAQVIRKKNGVSSIVCIDGPVFYPFDGCCPRCGSTELIHEKPDLVGVARHIMRRLKNG